MKIKPDPNCKSCKGGGILYQSEEFWGASCQQELFCHCVEEQFPNDSDEEIELDLESEEVKEFICPECGGYMEYHESMCVSCYTKVLVDAGEIESPA